MTAVLASPGDAAAITGGQPATIQDAPYEVALIDLITHGFSDCAGVLISPTAAIFPAHCMADKDVTSIGILSGTADLAGAGPGAMLSGASSIAINPGFDPGSLKNDIALVKLRGSASAPSAKLPVDPSIPESLVMTGWGAGGIGEPVSESLKKADFLLLPNLTCDLELGKSLPAGALCFSSVTAANCDGDSGDPLSNSGTVYGFSIGVGFCEKGRDGFGTKIFPYLDWIKSLA
ncbi:trypsin-like serine protease [Kitasatospora sp. NPDC096077]|uniref:trypsin-like serine protease n=1 Tax=Kitasatospora sp. NPDC096077 TaxID=3155544 RepID=UPI0033273E4A